MNKKLHKPSNNKIPGIHMQHVLILKLELMKKKPQQNPPSESPIAHVIDERIFHL